jgi:hypothetical protein
MDWRCGSSSRAPALQVLSPEIKPQSPPKQMSCPILDCARCQALPSMWAQCLSPLPPSHLLKPWFLGWWYLGVGVFGRQLRHEDEAFIKEITVVSFKEDAQERGLSPCQGSVQQDSCHLQTKKRTLTKTPFSPCAGTLIPHSSFQNRERPIVSVKPHGWHLP